MKVCVLVLGLLHRITFYSPSTSEAFYFILLLIPYVTLPKTISPFSYIHHFVWVWLMDYCSYCLLNYASPFQLFCLP